MAGRIRSVGSLACWTACWPPATTFHAFIRGAGMALVFLDFEASSLLPASFPIEVAWVLADGTGESHLIKPADGWLDPPRGNPGWSAESERVHGIPLSTLMEQGKPAEEVAARAEAVLSSIQVLACSDAPSHDAYWLQRLYEAGGIRRDASLVDVRRVYGMLCRPPARPPASSGRPGPLARRSNVCATCRLKSSPVPRKPSTSGSMFGTEPCLMPQALWRTHAAIRQEVARHLREGGR